jgi:hypothetical protein
VKRASSILARRAHFVVHDMLGISWLLRKRREKEGRTT